MPQSPNQPDPNNVPPPNTSPIPEGRSHAGQNGPVSRTNILPLPLLTEPTAVRPQGGPGPGRVLGTEDRSTPIRITSSGVHPLCPVPRCGSDTTVGATHGQRQQEAYGVRHT